MDKEHLSIEEVRDLPNGSKVTLNGYTKHGYRTEKQYTVVRASSSNILRYDSDKGPTFENIVDTRGKWFTEGWDN